MVFGALVCTGVLFSAVGCDDTDVMPLAPAIKIEEKVCKKNQGTSDCSINFEEVALSSRVFYSFKVSNPSGIALKIKEPTFSADTDPSFRLENWPNVVGKGLSSRLEISFRPMLESAVKGTLLIDSDAVNVSKPIEISLKGTGVDNGLPQILIEAQPPCAGSYPGSTEPADFGITGVDHPAACTFEVFNTGTKDLVLEKISFVEGETDPGFEFVGRVPGVDPDTGERFESVVPPPESGSTSSRSFVVRGIPGGLGVFTGVIVVQSNDPGCVAESGDGSCTPENSRTNVRVPVQIEGAHTPTAVARVLSINGDTQIDLHDIEPLDDVVLSAQDSYASSRSLRIVEYQWEIIVQPTGSHGFLDDAKSMTPRFMFDNSNNLVPGVDLAGFWAVKLQVTDSRGATSVNEAVISFNAIPKDAVHIQMVWDHPSSDVDLHLVREKDDGTWGNFDDDDCYFGNCKLSGGGLPWFADTESNPTLDVDDLSGYGPENINIETPALGRYKVAVHYWSDHGQGDTVCIIRLFLFGNLHSEYITELTDNDWWEVAILNWPSREIEVVNTITPDGH